MESHLSLAAETLFKIGPLPVTNTLLTSWLVTAFLVTIALGIKANLKTIPGKIQNLVELIIEGLYNLIADLAKEKTAIFFPIVVTFFLFIASANLMGLLPGFGTIGINEEHHGKTVFIPLLRSVNSDLNVTLALAICSLVITHFLAIKSTGLTTYLKKFFSLNPVFLFVGILEIVSELTKLVSLSFRLFGNIFAGEAVLTTISSIAAFIIPIPFLILEIIVGLVQATVFMMLTLAFMIILSHKTAH